MVHLEFSVQIHLLKWTQVTLIPWISCHVSREDIGNISQTHPITYNQLSEFKANFWQFQIQGVPKKNSYLICLLRFLRRVQRFWKTWTKILPIIKTFRPEVFLIIHWIYYSLIILKTILFWDTLYFCTFMLNVHSVQFEPI